jgi:ankyrin repeat protein
MVVTRGDWQMAELLIAKGADLNVANANGQTPLHLSVRQGRKDIVELLIKKGADVNAKNKWNRTPYDIAVDQGRKEIAGILLNEIAKSAISAVNNAFQQAVRAGDTDLVKSLISKGADVNARGRGDYTALHNARESIEIMRLLLANGADIEARQEHGATPLACVAYSGHIEAARLLIEHGADIEAKLSDGETTPLLRAVSQQHVETTKLLLDKGANIHATWRGLSAIHIAMDGDRLSNRKSNKEMVKLLVDRGLESPAIHLAAFYGDLQELKNYINNGAKVNEQDAAGYTPLHCAVCGDHMDIVKFLLGSGANVNARTKNGWTPLAFVWPVEMAELLIANGADVRVEDERGQTALHWAVNRNNHRGNRALIELLLKHGADINAKAASTSVGWAGWTPLHVACRNGALNIVELLVARGADVNVKTDKGETPIVIAKSNRQIVELLRKSGAKE